MSTKRPRVHPPYKTKYRAQLRRIRFGLPQPQQHPILVLSFRHQDLATFLLSAFSPAFVALWLFCRFQSVTTQDLRADNQDAT